MKEASLETKVSEMLSLEANNKKKNFKGSFLRLK